MQSDQIFTILTRFIKLTSGCRFVYSKLWTYGRKIDREKKYVNKRERERERERETENCQRREVVLIMVSSKIDSSNTYYVVTITQGFIFKGVL